MDEHEKKLTRRGLLVVFRRFLALSGLATLVGPIIAYFWPESLEEMPVGPVFVGEDGSIPVGESKVVPFGHHPALIINIVEKGLVAYSAVCTHFGCIVSWNPESRMIECPCHAGFYDPLDGSVISGPPPDPLEKLMITSHNGQIQIEDA
jgi:cytochrome b6-f complex iron-sulfur subunit